MGRLVKFWFRDSIGRGHGVCLVNKEMVKNLTPCLIPRLIPGSGLKK